ncbi:Lar family restriction alleviation protein [Brucella intermedia]|uniref:Lar family restriction alleviation protein n=1 Tax=Brucella intermedia TaxID=94625 RepID=UPI00224B0ACE|nr:Lar family restriction alleviation protein [Brucella intermedia]
MASELLPCPFCGAPEDELMIFADPEEAFDNSGPSRRIQCAGCHIEAPFYPSEAEAVAAWNTRPAPAATDTGLVTVGRKERSPHGVHFSVDLPEGTELVTRSQAEELLAAERVKNETQAETIDKLHGIITSLEADNAALTARIKALEAELDAAEEESCDLENDYMKERARAEALEAKLAAAEKTNDAMRKAAVDYCWQRYKGRDPLNLKNPAVFTSHEWEKIGETMDAAARAVLGGKPS